uniref:Uncharacterized protein n=1 Tax=Glossina austeni TaxID=7395 RepID=A0A1A9UMV3_GLOAU
MRAYVLVLRIPVITILKSVLNSLSNLSSSIYDIEKQLSMTDNLSLPLHLILQLIKIGLRLSIGALSLDIQCVIAANYSISLQQTKEITSNNVFKLLLTFLLVAADAIAVVVVLYPKHFSANIVKQQQQRHDDYDYDGNDDDGIRFQPKLDP